MFWELIRSFISAAILLFSTTQGVPVYQPNQAEEYTLSLEEATSIICQPQFLWDCQQMLTITKRESNFHPNSVNYSCYTDKLGKLYRCIGLLQILELNTSEVDKLYDPYYNVLIAYQLFLSGGYDHWRNTR